jgi:hypothetical protein
VNSVVGWKTCSVLHGVAMFASCWVILIFSSNADQDLVFLVPPVQLVLSFTRCFPVCRSSIGKEQTAA